VIFDVWNYNGDPVADARVELLSPFVDYFVVVEGLHTFTGKRKHDYYFRSAAFRTNPKVIFVPVHDYVNGTAWDNEAYQRDAALRCLRVIADDDALVFCGDADEIPNPGAYGFAHSLVMQHPMHVACPAMRFHYYNFNWEHDHFWTVPFFTNGSTLRQRTIQEIRKEACANAPILPDCGWHMSYADSLAGIRRKIESYSHTENDRPEVKTDEWLTSCIREGRDLFGRNLPIRAVPSHHLPPPLQTFNVRIRAAQGLK
jgi:beta-1,4-mannosyl-glycoprotein beta-1,4-N-acetylglucosaminyltransferase